MYKRKNKLNNSENMKPKIRRLNGIPENHCCNCTDLLESITTRLDNIIEQQTQHFTTVIKMITDQTALMKSLVRLENEESSISTLFPLQDENALAALDEQINEENRSIYIKGMKLLMRGNAKKKILSLLSQDVIVKYNLDGTHGKGRLKDFQNFYSVLKDAFWEDGNDPEDAIRKAMQSVKKYYFHNECIKKKQLTG